MLSIIIVNYNCVPLLMDCIGSIQRETTRIEYEILIVDNSNDQAGKDKLCQQYPHIKWIGMGYNSGFARANNAGIRQSEGDTVLLLNPDTLILRHAIDNCYRQLELSSYVAAGVQLQNPDGTPQTSGMFAMKGGLNYLLPLPYLGELVKWLGEKVNVKKPSIEHITDDLEVDWINGAFLMVKKAIIARSGLLDEDFFLYAEEAEWCSRIRRQGKLVIYGRENVIHLQGETANDSFDSEGKGYYNLYDKKGRQLIVSNFVRFRKEFGLQWFGIMLLFYVLEIPVFLIAGMMDNIFRLRNPFKHLAKWCGYCGNVAYLIWLTPTIVKNKPYFYKVV